MMRRSISHRLLFTSCPIVIVYCCVLSTVIKIVHCFLDATTKQVDLAHSLGSGWPREKDYQALAAVYRCTDHLWHRVCMLIGTLPRKPFKLSCLRLWLSGPNISIYFGYFLCGCSAEVTKNGVLSSPEHRVKASIRADTMIPAVALIDPQVRPNHFQIACPLCLLLVHSSVYPYRLPSQLPRVSMPLRR